VQDQFLLVLYTSVHQVNFADIGQSYCAETSKICDQVRSIILLRVGLSMGGLGAPLTKRWGKVLAVRGSLPPIWGELTLKSITFGRSFVWKWTKGFWPHQGLWAPGSIISRGGPPLRHRRRAVTTTWLAKTSWSSESDRWGHSAPELWGPHGLEEGKGQGYLASSRQYSNALLGVRH